MSATIEDPKDDVHPQRVFKLAVAAEVEVFKATKTICSSLDTSDQFVHMSDRTSAPVVAKLFFSKCQDLMLIEYDSLKFQGKTTWFVGQMGDAPPDAATREPSDTVIHYLLPDGCVHVYSKSGVGVSTDGITRIAAVPLGDDGVHVFPEWL
eukprot:m.77558 g.77558  ORF g.77558 m.77558 type:complete len:151 (-) comp25025_c0_seq1:532-984(-)